MSEEQELTKEELHRNAIRARLAEVSTANRERRRMEAMLIRVADRHAHSLARQLRGIARPPYKQRPRLWVRRLTGWVRSWFYPPVI